MLLANWIAIILLLFYSIPLAHECGHALMAKFCGRRILSFEIGFKWLSFSWHAPDFHLRFGFPPFYGNCQHKNPDDDRSEKRRLMEEIIITFAGPLTSSAFLLLVWATITSSGYFHRFQYFVAGLIFFELANLLPFCPDGKRIKSLFRKYRALPR